MRKPTEGTAIEVDLVAAPEISKPLASCRADSCASGRFRTELEELQAINLRETEIATNLRQVGPSHPRRTLSLHWTARCEKRKVCHFDVLAVKDKIRVRIRAKR